MRTLPVSLRIDGRRCVVVGGDAPAAAKAGGCVRAGGDVVVIAPALCAGAATMAAAGELRHVPRTYRDGDLAGAFLAYASTRDPALIARLVDEARREHVLLNVVDVPEACTFISPAVVERGELTVAIATGGASPGLSAGLRRELDAQLGPEYGPFVAILGAVRRAVASDAARASERAGIIGALLASPLLELVRRGDRAGIDALLARLAGPACTLDRLGIVLPDAEAA